MEQRTAGDVLKLVKDAGIEVIDVRFCDLPGLMQHFSIPAHELTADVFEEGLGFDGSSIRGWKGIQESDMLLIPDPNTAVVDPFTESTDVDINCYITRSADQGEIVTRATAQLSSSKAAHVLDAAPGIRRHRLLRTRGRVLHLRLGALRPEFFFTRATTSSTRSKACGTRAAMLSRIGSTNLGYKPLGQRRVIS